MIHGGFRTGTVLKLLLKLTKIAGSVRCLFDHIHQSSLPMARYAGSSCPRIVDSVFVKQVFQRHQPVITIAERQYH